MYQEDEHFAELLKQLQEYHQKTREEDAVEIIRLRQTARYLSRQAEQLRAELTSSRNNQAQDELRIVQTAREGAQEAIDRMTNQQQELRMKLREALMSLDSERTRHTETVGVLAELQNRIEAARTVFANASKDPHRILEYSSVEMAMLRALDKKEEDQ